MIGASNQILHGGQRLAHRFRHGDSMRPGSVLARLHLDAPLVAGLLLLAVTGLVVLHGVGGGNGLLETRQAIRLGIAFAAMLVVAQVSPVYLQLFTPWLYAVVVLLLVAVPLVGDTAQGAQRWLALGPLRFQPSEFAKLSVPLMVAYVVAGRPLPPSLPRLLAGALAVAVPTLLVARQPDLGTAVLVGSSGAFVLFLAGMRWRIIFSLLLLAAACAPLLWHFMRDYQRQRVLTFLDPQSDPLGAGYHVIQSKIAIGSGGLYGKGWGNGTQSRLEFLPERSTDFVFSVFSEEFGLVGVLLLLLAYLLVVARGVHLAVTSQETFGRVAGGALVLTFFVYVFVNIGMVSGLMPVVGIPLPLISYGGTSMVTLMIAFGILMSFNTHRRLLSR